MGTGGVAGGGGVGADGGVVDAGVGGASAGSLGGTTGTGCQSPQTSFGLIGQGDSNPNFQSGVGALGTNVMYIFSSYETLVVGDGGTASQQLSTFRPSTPRPAQAREHHRSCLRRRPSA